MSVLCPEIGQNSRGFALLRNEGSRPVVVESVESVGFLKVRDIETNKIYMIFYQQFTPSPTIPSRFRRYVFEQVAPYWAQALEKYPNAVIVSPTSLSAETLARKLREGREAKNRYSWTSPLVDEEKWNRLSEKLIVTLLANNTVQIGPAEAKEVTAFEAVITTKNEIFIKWKTVEELENFCKVAKLFEPKPLFVVFDLTPPLIESIESRFDVGFVSRESGKAWDVIF
jgi:hypothetical protein